MTAIAAGDTAPDVGQLVRVRGQQWVVNRRSVSTQPRDELATEPPGRTLVTLSSVSDDDLGDELTVAWEIEPGREMLPETRLPAVTESGWDDPQTLGAFLDAVRWGTVASADDDTLQAPFRSGITIEDYQLEPVAKALGMPRVALLIADDVGLGKTIEAGLVMQEMLLRNRARRVIVVCPAPLTGKWRDELAEKFGLDFTVLNAEALKTLRRSHGLEANPFSVFPRTIVSLPWLRTPRVQRLLDEVLVDSARHPGFFDILVVDEAHHCAPPAPGKGRKYALDSLQTRAVRRLGDFAQHRMFLSATPHNGYSESWQALLELLDPRRFARGVEPRPEVVQQVMVRRLKDDLTLPDGSPRFPGRHARALEVAYTADEQTGHELLSTYTESRRNVPGGSAVRAGDLISLLLKKRMFSSPAAFARTLDAHRATVARAGAPVIEDNVPEWLTDALSWEDEPDPDEAEADVLARAAATTGELNAAQAKVLEELHKWAQRRAEPADSKADVLVNELRRLCPPGSETRVIVFTEYRDTQVWLAGILDARGLGGERLGLLHGGMDDKQREHLKDAFQASPDRDPLRFLLATDAASEGIDLQRHCHTVIHYDIPFNPNRLEQRIGRVDRYGQSSEVDVVHFVGAAWRSAVAGSYDGDLEFLSRVAAKVATERRDLGSVNPVLAGAVEAQMLGRPLLVDPMTVKASPAATVLKAEQGLRAQAERLRAQLDQSVARLHVAPDNVRRVVDTALSLAQQPPLADRRVGEVEPPELRSGWERTLTGLPDPLSGELRTLTFDADVARGRDDVVLAHLGHPLVAQSTRLLRSAVWGGRTDLYRVTAVRFSPPDSLSLRGPVVMVLARLVVVGADGGRLHEEIVLAGRELPDKGPTRRMDLQKASYSELRTSVEAALEPDACTPAPLNARNRLAQRWDELTPRLVEDLRLRATAQKDARASDLAGQLSRATQHTRAVYDQLRATLQTALANDGAVQLAFDDLDKTEQQQFERDRQAWQQRLDALEEDRDREVDLLNQRYGDVKELVFPFAVVLAVPEGNN
ncbi:DISARM system SNF2-like helicase DrmD [Rhodococcus sp. IEGM 1401]|uniref:DISARM system SNF2-like helicase DrmD n=1 Tax=unclassified Rhodococcus (in: high G+C Gram-positive bacteria) TaxID=192944 RepID=UPI0022B3888E|nr:MULTISPECIES: DISARM system SNF2-like helicase DrmD [unclassified Rhodococcus (in: high G+C Gram-positive bacteria)]MCZ4564226.1 DISARM system SNF2-like helicase DrmD [Rhodococcus sp. IEGM 1401]MDI9924356.1 DISARM system SNF2-like helicase DrmD [Rhodococcus sp. IEGM 1372]MDV8036803.1 DISARM system SNF2-like helicase DrmD [Rhodococcus sp. IEGM 1414]